MGLDISHNTWHGAYSAFHRWRQEIARAAGMPPLELMEGFFCHIDGTPYGGLPSLYNGTSDYSHNLKNIDERLPIKWDSLKPSPLHELLCHSDCDGYINYSKCRKISDELEKLLPLLDKDLGGHIGNCKEKTEQFIKGLRDAYTNKEKLKFR